jgi:enoyl-CoA hydratase/carnithine racemase
MAEHRVTVSIDGGVAHVRLDRPDKRNALDLAMFRAIAEAGEALKAEAGLRVVVLSGAGPSFCAGLDVSAFEQIAGGGGIGGDGGPGIGDLTASGVTHLGQQICWVWQELEVPVIAAVHGHALGGGLQLALGADIRIAHPDTKLSVREAHWGLTPDMTGTFTLARLVRPDVAKELSFTARIIDAREGHAVGLVTRLSDDPLAAADALAAEIVGRSPESVRGVKAMFNAMLNTGFAEQFALERRTIGALIGTPNQVEAIAASFDSRPPAFT